MRKNEFLTKTLLFGAFALATAACSNEELAEVNPNINSGDDAPKLSITVKAPAGEGVVIRSATRAEIQDATEKAIKTVKVYLFKQDGSGTEETSYKFHSTMSFDATGDDAKGIVAYTDNSDGTYTCTKAIPSSLMGAKIKVAIIANDEAAATDTTSTTTLYGFRTGVLASATRSATVEDGTYFTADTLVGGTGDTPDMAAEGATGFPMAYIPSDSYDLTATGVAITAQLVRNVARIDICNYATDLTITGVELTNVKEKSYLFGGSSDALNVPSNENGLTGLLIKPMKEYADSLSREGNLPYNAAKDEITDSDREDQIKTLNTHRAFYLYEQAVTTDETSPKVTISYSVKSDSETDAKTGSVDVYFKTTGETATYVNVERNHIYTIVLGDGGAVSQGTVKAKFVVKDWIEGETIDEELTPDEDANQD